HLRDDAHRAIRLHDLDGHHAVATEHRHVSGLARLANQLDHDRPRLTEEPHVSHVALAELEAADPEAVVLRGAVLLDVAARFQGGEQAEDVVLVQLQALRELRDAELFGVETELLEHVERVRHGLDDVVRILPAHFPRPPQKRVLGYDAARGESTRACPASRSLRSRAESIIYRYDVVTSRQANAVLTGTPCCGTLRAEGAEMDADSAMIDVQTPGGAMPAQLARPGGDVPLPAVIVIQEAFGLNGHIKGVARRLAAEGYVTLALDMFHRGGAGRGGGRRPPPGGPPPDGGAHRCRT